MAQSSTGKASKCSKGRQRSGASAPHSDDLITSAERRKRKASAEPATKPSSKRQPSLLRITAADQRESTPEACAQGVCKDSPGTDGGSSRDSLAQPTGRTAAQSPRAGQARPPAPAAAAGKGKGGVLGSILQPVLSLLQGGSNKAEQEEQPGHSEVILEDGRRAHVGLHHCDGGPEPARHDMPLQQVEGMPLCEQQQVEACAEQDREGTSTDGESDTRVDEGAVCASVSSGGSGEAEEGGQRAEGGGNAPAVVYDEEEYEEECIDFDPYAFIKNLPPLQQVVPRWRRSLLPRQTRACKRKTLVLDLDETLVHSTLDGCDAPDFSFPVSFNNREHRVQVRRRPHLAPFLQRCAELFEVVVFTASQKVYAEQLLNILDPARSMIRHRVFRDSCVFVEGNYLKDLSVLGRDLAHTIIVDNSPQAFGYQLPNGIPIESWYDDEEDAELARLLPFLETLVDVPDVRPPILAAYKLNQLVEKAPTYTSYA